MSDKVVRRRLADGSVKEYRYPRRRRGPPTVGDVIAAYKDSYEWRRLKPSTKKAYGFALEEIREHENVLVAEIRRRHIKNMRDDLSDTPAFANLVVAVWRNVLNQAVEDELVIANVAVGIKKLQTGEYVHWSEEQISYGLTNLTGSFWRLMVLGLYTGQRIGDCCRMTKADYDGSAIRVVQEKTGAKLWVEAHKDLRHELDSGAGPTTASIWSTRLLAPRTRLRPCQGSSVPKSDNTRR